MGEPVLRVDGLVKHYPVKRGWFGRGGTVQERDRGEQQHRLPVGGGHGEQEVEDVVVLRDARRERRVEG